MKLADEKAGRQEDFEEMFIAHYRELVVYSCKFVKETEVAEDLVQEMFYHLWTKQETYQITGNIRSFLFHSARNAALNYLTRVKKMTVELSRQMEDDIIFQEDIETIERDRKLYALIERLPEQRKRIFKMCFFENMHYQEVAEKLHISVNTVKTQMGRALSELRNRADELIFFLIFKKIRKNL